MSKQRPVRDGELWYTSEEVECLGKYKAGWPIDDIAEYHDRYPNAIRIRLEKMGVSCFNGALKEYLTKDKIHPGMYNREYTNSVIKQAPSTAGKRRLLLL